MSLRSNSFLSSASTIAFSSRSSISAPRINCVSRAAISLGCLMKRRDARSPAPTPATCAANPIPPSYPIYRLSMYASDPGSDILPSDLI